MDKKLKDIIANRFSLIFGGPHMSACGCMGIPLCTRTSCSMWWDIVLRDAEIAKKAEEIYTSHKEEIENGLPKLLAKRFMKG